MADALDLFLQEQKEIAMRNYHKDWIKFRYLVRGKLGITLPNRDPVQFTIHVKSGHETVSNLYKAGNMITTNLAGRTILIPENCAGTFLKHIPLGTEIVFKEAGERMGDKLFSHTYSVKVIPAKKKRSSKR